MSDVSAKILGGGFVASGAVRKNPAINPQTQVNPYLFDSAEGRQEKLQADLKQYPGDFYQFKEHSLRTAQTPIEAKKYGSQALDELGKVTTRLINAAVALVAH